MGVAETMKNAQHGVMGKKVPETGGNTSNTPKPPGHVGGNSSSAPKPSKQTQTGGNYVSGQKVP